MKKIFVLRKVYTRLGCWLIKSLSSLWSLVGLWGWTTTLELRTVQTSFEGSSEEFWAMSESLTQLNYVSDEDV